MTRVPKGRGVIWMRRIANVGFGIAALYFAYLVAIIFISMKVNAEFEGKPIGDLAIEIIQRPGAPRVPENLLVKADIAAIDVPPTKRAVVLWATWCGPCHSLLMELKNELEAGRLKAESVLAVSMAEPYEDVAAYLAEYPLPFPVALDREGHLARRMKLQGTPTIIFLNANGVIEKVSTGGIGLSGKILDFVK